MVPDQLGHTKPEMKRRYARRAPNILADALEARRGIVISIETASFNFAILEIAFRNINDRS